MRLILAIIVGLVIYGAFSADSKRAEMRDTIEQQAEQIQEYERGFANVQKAEQSTAKSVANALAKEKAEATDLAKRLATEHTNCDTLAKANSELKLDLKAAQDAVADLRQQLGTATKRADDNKQRVAELEAEARRTKKEMLLLHDRCEPPDTVAVSRQPQLEAPFDLGKNGKRIWLTDWDRAKDTAQHMKRLNLLVMSTKSCIHCKNAMSAYAADANMEAVLKDYVPCWLTVLDEDTRRLARRIGAYDRDRSGRAFGFPCAALIDQETNQYVMFRPTENADEVIEQLERERKRL